MTTEQASKKGPSPRRDASALREIERGSIRALAPKVGGSAGSAPVSKRFAQTVRGEAMPELPRVGPSSGRLPAEPPWGGASSGSLPVETPWGGASSDSLPVETPWGEPPPDSLPVELPWDGPASGERPVAPVRGGVSSGELPVAPVRGGVSSGELPVAPVRGGVSLGELPVAPVRGGVSSGKLPAAMVRGGVSSGKLPAAMVRGGASSGGLPVNLGGEGPSSDTGIEVSGYQSALRLAALREGATAGSIASPESTQELDAAIEALRTSVLPRSSRSRAGAGGRRARRLLVVALATFGVAAGLGARFGRERVARTVSALRANVGAPR